MSWEPSNFDGRLREAVDAYDRPASEAACAELVKHLAGRDAPYPRADARNVLGILRRKRHFDLIQTVAEAFLAGGQEAPEVRRQYAQALLDQGLPCPAIALLEQLVRETDDGDRENAQARGLLGRAYKERYFSFTSPDTDQARRSLNEAVRWYRDVYAEDPTKTWHGINAVALLARAQRDGVPVDGIDDPGLAARHVAGELRADLVAKWDRGEATIWDAGTAAEASVALGDPDEALTWSARYVEDPRVDAFELASTLRQLTKVWDLRPSAEPGASVLPLLRAELLGRKGGNVELGGEEKMADQGGSLVDRDRESLEKVLGNARYQSIKFLVEAVSRARSIARIETPWDEAIGTGFLVRGEDLNPSLGSEPVVVTNAHVVSEEDRERGQGALHPEDAVVAFYFLGGGSRRTRVEVRNCVWSSPSGVLDTTLLRVEAPDGSPDAYPFARRLPAVGPGKEDQRIYVIGHPGGGGLSVSLQDNLLLDHEGPPGGAPPNPEVRRIHYRSPTEPGSSGSPVFNRMWKLIGLHHAGKRSMPRLNGRPGTYPANEGIWIGSVREALARDLDR